MKLLENIRRELEKPREKRPLGSGWLSGGGALLAGIAGLFLVFIRSFPATLTMPELSVIHNSGYVTVALNSILLIGYVLSLLSILLSRNKVLGWTALALVITASLIGTGATPTEGGAGQSLYFGLDYFVINVLFVGFVFVPLERFFPHLSEQTVLRGEWREDLFYYLVSSLLVQILTFLTFRE
ncbi:hypothetical protein [Halocynthiibacter namhaensis]|uniref:hypothetical protein n=1 Tax=Halocynthiibacter namhaensis TaxID=1290553 RepID=UPI000A53C733|nr:hypothetical protein [Halocynthiibacter namhaensis]